jgi:hypothetical protein
MVRFCFLFSKIFVWTNFYLGGFQPPGGIDNRAGYNPRGPFSPGGPRGGMYPIQPLPPLVDVPFGGGPGLSARYPNPALLTSTRVSSPAFL